MIHLVRSYVVNLFILIFFCSNVVAQISMSGGCATVISGNVSDKLTKMNLSEANVVLFEINKNDFVLLRSKNETYKQNYKLQSRLSFETDNNGAYKIQAKCNKYYRLATTINGFVTKVEAVSTGNEAVKNLNFELENKEVFRDSINRLLVKLKPVEFEINSLKITPTSRKEIKKVLLLLKKYPNLEIEIGVFASSLGNDNFNLELTQKRANYIKTYLESYKWLNKHRLTAVGYGESKLLNKCSNGVKCRLKDHNKNKRVEFLVKSNYIPTSNLNYLESDSSEL